MRSPQRVVWSEGMLLSPQHLQALDRFHEAHLAARVACLAPQEWGVTAVEIDPAALAKGEVRLLRFAGVLPDGLVLAFDDAESAPPPRAVAERFPAAAHSMAVYLGVPRERDTVPSVADEGAPSASRHLASTRTLADATAPGATAPVRLARPNAVLLLGDEPREDHEALQIAEVVRAPSGQLALSEAFVPPCLRLAASPWLSAGVRDVLTRAIAKARELAELRRDRESASDVTVPDLMRLLQHLILGAHIPVLAHLAEEGRASPRECYLALAGLRGQLCTFRGEDPTDVPKFQHLDLRATFDPLFSRLGEMLGEIASHSYVTVPLEQRPGGLFLARLSDERLLRAQLFLLVASDRPESAVVEEVARHCKIAAASEIQALLGSALRGLPLEVVHRPPPEIPLRAGTVYFTLRSDDRYWQGIVSGKNFALYLPRTFDPARTKLELLAIPSESSPGTP